MSKLNKHVESRLGWGKLLHIKVIGMTTSSFALQNIGFGEV